MQHQNEPDHHPVQRNIQPQTSTISDQDILFAMDSENSAENTVWVPDNYHDIHLSSDDLDDIMNEATDSLSTFQRLPPQSLPISAPSQASHSNIQPKEEHQQITPTTPTPTHHSHPHPHHHAPLHSRHSHNLPPQPPTSHILHTHQRRIMLQPHQLHTSHPPHPLIQQHLPVSQHMSQLHSNQPFSLPHTIEVPFSTKQEPTLAPSIPHYLPSPEHQVVPNVPPYPSPQEVLPLQTHPTALDRDIYVNRSRFKADQAKLVHRTQLKQEQKEKEADAEARGSPLTAKDKERERSRRESAVTRKRAEVYISELERVSRRLPEVEQQLKLAEAELQRLRRTIANFEHQSRQSEQIDNMQAVSRQLEVKSEPSLTLSPSSERTTTVMTRMQQLDLRLPNRSEEE